MRFRQRLAKDVFKNKKVPSERVAGENNISEDQRGDNSWTDSKLLSLDGETSREEKQPVVEDLSRRGFLSLGRLGDFAEAVEEGNKKKKKRKKPSAVEEPEAEAAATETGDALIEEEPASVPETEEKKGLFRRLFDRFRPGPVSAESSLQEDPEPDSESAAPSSQVEPVESARAEPETKAPAPSPTTAPAPEPFEEPEELEEPEPEEEGPELDRRNLLRQGVHFFAKPAVAKVQEKIDKVNETVDKIVKRVPILRPPGAISEKHFLEACTRCDKCIHACPKDAIKRAPKQMGFFAIGTPYIDPKKNPCVMCDDLPCISACPDEALLPVASKFEAKMGYAILDKGKCQAYGDTFCQQCLIDCPIPGAITQVDQKPVFHKNVCTGCGVCVLSCSTVNIPLAIKVKPQMVIESQIRKKQLEEKKARERAERLAAQEEPLRESSVAADDAGENTE